MRPSGRDQPDGDKFDGTGHPDGRDQPDGGSRRRVAIRDGVAVGVGVGSYGVAFGAAGVAAGLTVAQTCVLSLLVFTGASQFALVGTISAVGAGGGALAGVGPALLLGVRNTFYGVRLSELLPWRGWRRLVAAHGVIDETTAMALAQPTPALARVAFVATGLSVYTLWNLATLVGAAGAASLGDPADLGLDAAVPAGFLALLAPRLREGRTQVRVAVAGAAIALALTPWLPAGVPVLCAAAGALAAFGPGAGPTPDGDARPGREP